MEAQQVEIRNQQVLTGTQGERSIEQESISNIRVIVVYIH